MASSCNWTNVETLWTPSPTLSFHNNTFFMYHDRTYRDTSALYGVMVLYVIIGIAPFALMITGLLMYWNRSFVKKVRRVRARMHAPVGDLAGGRADLFG